MNTHDAPDFFQQSDEKALRKQAQWLDDKLGLDSRFLSKVLHRNEAEINEWRNKIVHLPVDSQGVLSELWHLVLHLLSHYNNEEYRVRQLVEQTASLSPTPLVKLPRAENASSLCPPWFRSSLKAYLEAGGTRAIAEVNHWVMSLRFGDPYPHLPT